MSIDYSILETGQIISSRTYCLSADVVERYVEAVGGRPPMLIGTTKVPAVPPMAVASLSLRGVVEDMGIPSGTLHSGQELEFHMVVSVGESVKCEASISQSSVRGGRQFVTVALSVCDSEGLQVMSGKSTLVTPTNF